MVLSNWKTIFPIILMINTLFLSEVFGPDLFGFKEILCKHLYRLVSFLKMVKGKYKRLNNGIHLIGTDTTIDDISGKNGAAIEYKN